MNSLGLIYDQPECRECRGVCCTPERLAFPAPQGMGLRRARAFLADLGLFDAKVLAIKVDAHGRTVVATDCPRRHGGLCDAGSRPVPCLKLPASYLADDHSDAERSEIREFCALFHRLEKERDDAGTAAAPDVA